MLLYLITNFIVILFSIIFKSKNHSTTGSNYNSIKIIYLVAIGALLLIIAGFRGDFTSDYKDIYIYLTFIIALALKEFFTITLDKKLDMCY